MFVALRGKTDSNSTADAYFLSSRNLRWYSVALSTIATNVQGYQFLGMMGSAYLYGLAQANLEINAVQGILLGTFVFVPLFLKEKITTITQFISKKLGQRIAVVYSVVNMLLFSTITLGAALFWGAYAADLVFEEQLSILHENRIIRIGILIVILGVFSAIYTYFGGLNAVVKTDIIQFAILILGGAVVCFVSIKNLGGWEQLYIKTPEKMHLHLSSDHPTLPWTHLFGLFFLNINYWCANQTIMQRALAAKKHQTRTSRTHCRWVYQIYHGNNYYYPRYRSLRRAWRFSNRAGSRISIYDKNVFTGRLKRNHIMRFICLIDEHRRFDF